ncbi:MAG: DUF1573 domain-containing protein [Flavobacteriales bacterium]
MKKLLLLLLVAPIIFAGCNSSDSVLDVSADLIDPENPPVMEFEETTFNFGDIAEGQTIQHAFKFKNTGKSPLLLNSVKPSCGCTVMKDWPKNPIKSGESAQINIEFTANASGQTRKTITILANTRPSTLKLYLEGNVVGPTEQETNTE